MALRADTSAPLTQEQERDCDAIGNLDDPARAQRLADWAAYGDPLRAHIEVATGQLAELSVPVVVHVDTSRPYGHRERYSDLTTLGDELVQTAVKATPMPGNGADPLRRLEATTELSDREEGP